MSEPGAYKEGSTGYRSAVDRAKSMKDIMEQYSRIDNQLYRRYLDYEIDEDEYWRRKKKLNDTYDRYEVNMANDQGFPITRHGEGGGNSSSYYLHNMDLKKKVSRKVYAKK